MEQNHKPAKEQFDNNSIKVLNGTSIFKGGRSHSHQWQLAAELQSPACCPYIGNRSVGLKSFALVYAAPAKTEQKWAMDSRLLNDAGRDEKPLTTEPEEEEFVVNGIYALVIGYEVFVKQ